ncbi:hypothetical protein K504DRAFT_420418 [Pleomassaria siparia CBS 279.74]|uniref:GST N-terminal domain-containing protein n=1 Tax=Pleomassaria siparia CBS 279.74 TaxID=1314801 RepID=A0A6G1KNV9_9PLEO|nr:hypothetical protein K504DRAFT_420418 [Pleomassaria siparia CBS 279.74]
MTSNPSIIFYDIASAPPLRTFAPNPWKTRFSLNIKGLPYRTQWTDLPDIAALREKLGVPANRTLPDGTAFHTLPVLQDLSTNTILGDTFEIALYLDKTYPDGPSLILPGTTGLTAAFNAHVDGLFTKFTVLCDQMPFDPRIAEAVQAIFAKRFGVKSLADMQLKDDEREPKLVALEAALGELAKAYRHTVGPWLDGERPMYADVIVGAWLKMMEASMKGEEWQRVRKWQGGLWGRVVDGLEGWSEIV